VNSSSKSVRNFRVNMKPRYLWVILFYFTFVYSFHSCLKTIHKLYPNEVSEELWFEQRLDHFNNQNQVYWKQRYYVNDTFYNPNLGGPIFVEIGGEGDLSPFYVTRSQLVHYGQKFGALMVAVEHRFYGKKVSLFPIYPYLISLIYLHNKLLLMRRIL